MGFWVFPYQFICLLGNNCSLDKCASVAASPPLAFKLYANIGRNYFFFNRSIIILRFRERNHLRWGSESPLLAHVLNVWPVGQHTAIGPVFLYALVLACGRHVLC